MTKITRRAFVPLVAAATCGSARIKAASPGASWAEPAPSSAMWFRNPAAAWIDALPIGNGRLGGMVFGGTREDRIALNEDTLYSGCPQDGNNPHAREVLPQVREAVLQQQDYLLADRLCQQMQGPFGQAYQPLGDLHLSIQTGDTATNYHRELDLETAIARTTFELGDAQVTKEYFVSVPDNVLVVRAQSSQPLSWTVRLDSKLRHNTTAQNHALTLQGKAPNVSLPNYVQSSDSIRYSDEAGRGMYFACEVRIVAPTAKIDVTDHAVHIANARDLYLLVAANTGFKSYAVVPDTPAEEVLKRARQTLDGVVQKPVQRIRADHIRAHQTVFRRVRLDLGKQNSARPVDERVASFAATPDPSLLALYFDFGRYLLISSSRPGTQPANLQGIWSEDLRPPWSCNWTSNINVQMNYWLAETCNLSEFHLPLFDMMHGLAKNGAITAQVNYGLPGWVSHHNIDLWCLSSPVGEGKGAPTWANFAMSAPWLCAHLWEHYQFTGDREFLRSTAYPLMKGSAQFCSAWLISDGKGHLTTCPSVSTENDFRTPEGKSANVSAGCTLDIALVRELFTHCSEAAAILGEDASWAAHLNSQVQQLPAYAVGRYGQLQEWSIDFEEPTPGQRHMSHLYPMYPGSEFDMERTPKWSAASRKSLERRLANGGAYTGWSRAWASNLWARFADGEQAWRSLQMHLKHSTAGNFFDTHPADEGAIFQIDGNFGTTSAIAEMLLQSHNGLLRILPALPAAWSTGSFHGLKARGGATVSCAWNRGRLRQLTLQVPGKQTCRIQLPASAPRLARVVGARFVAEGPCTYTVELPSAQTYAFVF